MPSPDRPSTDRTMRPLRADAKRNREMLVAVARKALSTADGAISLEAVARDAGVGIGTLYRHFPTREALIGAVYAAELDSLVASAATLLDDLPPEAALREWVTRYATFAATKRGMIDTLRSGVASGKIVTPSTRARVTQAIEPILTAGIRAGSLRDDVSPDDVIALLLGVFLSTASHDTSGQTGRLLDLILAALRPTGPETASAPNEPVDDQQPTRSPRARGLDKVPDQMPLPSIGAPATRALAAAGYTRLEQLDGVPRGELAALHGVGPKALRILQEELAATGRSLG